MVWTASTFSHSLDPKRTFADVATILATRLTFTTQPADRSMALIRR
jgi:hypothetical protein